jgi:hypothetical protein
MDKSDDTVARLHDSMVSSRLFCISGNGENGRSGSFSMNKMSTICNSHELELASKVLL